MLGGLTIIIKGAGEMASGIAWRLYRAGFKKIVMLDIEKPLAVRRRVCFCETVYEGRKTVDGVEAILAGNNTEINSVLEQKCIPVVVDPKWETIGLRRPQVVIDAIIAKRNLGTNIDEAELVIGVGPGFTAAKDVHVVVESNRGPNCGRLLYSGAAEKNTGIPGKVMGYDVERVIRAPASGIFKTAVRLDEQVKVGDTVGYVNGKPTKTVINGSVRGLIRDQIYVDKNLKIGDIEPRKDVDNSLVSDKSLCLGGAVLEAIMGRFNL